MNGIDPDTGLSVSGSAQAAQRLKRAISTQIGTRPKRRKVGGEVRKQNGTASEEGRMIIINRIHRVIANPHNQLADIKNPIVQAAIAGAGYRVRVIYDYYGEQGAIDL